MRGVATVTFCITLVRDTPPYDVGDVAVIASVWCCQSGSEFLLVQNPRMFHRVGWCYTYPTSLTRGLPELGSYV